MISKKKPTWKEVKTVLSEKDKSGLLKLISDLYSLSAENQSFIHSRYSIAGKTLEPYRSIISEALYPDIYKNKPLRLSVGKKAISDYFKATGDKLGQLELRVHFLETGAGYTADLGDINEHFYSSLESMFDCIIATLRQQPGNVQERYLSRLEEVVVSAENIGWGYYDYISDVFEKFILDRNA